MSFRSVFVIASVAVAFFVSVPARAGKLATFDGEWAVQWCDRGDPKAECGGFFLSLVQHGRVRAELPPPQPGKSGR